MKKIVYLLLVALVFTSCQKQKKIGFVDNGTLINDYQEKKDLEEKFKGLEDTFKKKTDSMSQAFQLEVQQTQLKAQKSSRKKAQELMGGLQQKQSLLQQQIQFEQNQIAQSFQTEIDSLIIKVKDFVKDYGKANQYDFILGTSEGAASVLYGKDETDLTQSILDALNAEYKK
ncbi:OmpH family outer membrane protein [Seonamhaeicola marinus]|uniref:OmpH family outer membrane protein n=1 Tax=Seonamhaeicola marinus TaxID=1912246 RepID=A0A5D0HS51_9FLAO|nr:OmpH family outer membrane protein [Seonamhaeicola marinus]TYA74166.1 OmpH family outer membrane protein [Seonamhaeicola marinus]